MCELFTAITRETTDALTSPRATSILQNYSNGVWLSKPRDALCFVLVNCGRWNFEQSRHSHGPWLGKSLGRARVNGFTDAVWSLPPPLMCELFIAITREATDALTSPRATSISSHFELQAFTPHYC
ncbi:hypothetical protein AVEN_221091-1 [Araneus ventricosus]|uniref:Uncharacterized protein n=1 Tax=Araneus ventricosus TaxID=182803 RepID=A0A4Y2MRC6_ARAVE|nr:hypothetical protein AVEN_221091-1 [Araneus ventricosus]